jgi:hypothetical protein
MAGTVSTKETQKKTESETESETIKKTDCGNDKQKNEPTDETS